MTDEVREIRELIDSWIAASNAGDLSALLEKMTDDVVFMTPSRAPFGKAEFAADSERMKGASVEAQAEVQEIEVFRRTRLCAKPNPGRPEAAGRPAAAAVGIRHEHPQEGRRRPMAHRARRQSRHARGLDAGRRPPRAAEEECRSLAGQ